MTASARIAFAASHDPTTWGQDGPLTWTAPLSEHQRAEMHQEAIAALQDNSTEEQVDFSVVEALAADWRVARLLMGRPEFAASVQSGWRVSDFWFHGPEWQAKEREVDADRAAGARGRVYESEDAFEAALAALDQAQAARAHV